VDGCRKILDISSGIDSVSLALEATGITATDHEVLCIDSSLAMQRFARNLNCMIRRRHVTVDIEGFLSTTDLLSVDAIFLSYAFDYEHERRPGFLEAVADQLAGKLAQGGFILYAGPEGKRALADKLKSHFARYRDVRIDDLSSNWPSHLRERYSMPLLQNAYGDFISAARRGGLSESLYRLLLNPYTGAPSWIFTHTTDPQTVFAVSRT